jgi:hypothetical protein
MFGSVRCWRRTVPYILWGVILPMLVSFQVTLLRIRVCLRASYAKINRKPKR